MTGPVARPATAADIPEVLRLAAAMFASMGLEPSGPWQGQAAEVLHRRLGSGTAAAFVIDDPDRRGRLRAGAAVTVNERLPVPGTPAGRFAYVQYVYTEPDHRGQGLGRAVMTALLAWLEATGVTDVELHATGDGEALYRSLGFAENPEVALRRLRR